MGGAWPSTSVASPCRSIDCLNVHCTTEVHILSKNGLKWEVQMMLPSKDSSQSSSHLVCGVLAGKALHSMLGQGT